MKAAIVLAVLSQAVDGARRVKNNSGIQEDCFGKYDGKSLLKLAPCSEEDVKDMWALAEAQDCLVLTEEEMQLRGLGGCAEALVVCDDVAAGVFVAKFGGASIITGNAGAHFRETSGAARPFDAPASVLSGDAHLAAEFYSDWRDLDARMQRVEAAVASSGGAAKLETAGSSYEDRPIKVVRFTGKGYKSGMPKVVLTFNVHAREWIAGMSGVYAVETLAAKVKSNPSFLSGMEVVMVPMANPDGFVYSTTKDRFHRKNMRPGGWFCRGVDVNRNFAVHWAQGGSSASRCSDTYHGTAAMSEPESNVLAGIMKESPMSVYIDIHAYSELILSSWGYTKEDNPRKAAFEDLGLKMKSAISGKHGKSYTYGPIAQTLYPASGSMSDYATTLGALGYCIELRPSGNQGSNGFAPPASEIQPTAEECFEAILESITYARTMS